MPCIEVGETREKSRFYSEYLDLRCLLHIKVVDEIVILLQTMLSSCLKMSSKHSDERIWTSGKASESEVYIVE